MTGTADGVDEDRDQLVVGVDYTVGAIKFGASYFDQETDDAGLDVTRYTGGVVYTAGPGLSFRGSVSQVELEDEGFGFGSDVDATSVLGGIQINF